MKIYKNVLTEGTLKACLETYNGLRKRFMWESSTQNWQDGVKTGIIGLVTGARVPPRLAATIKKEIELLLPPHDGINFKYYVWNKMSGIPWHNDHNHHFAGTLYLNEKWNTDYGGVFLYREKRDDVEFNAVAPAQNMLVLNDSKQDHMVTPISPLAPEDRITIQLWGF